MLLRYPNLQRVLELCEQHRDVNSLTESTSQILLSTQSAVNPKVQLKAPRKLKSNSATGMVNQIQNLL